MELKLKRIVKISKILIYLCLGILILLFRNDIYDYLYLIVSLPILYVAVQEFIYEIYTKSYLNELNKIGSLLIEIILATIILFTKTDIELLCIIWGIIVIIKGTTALNNVIHLLVTKKFIAASLEGIEAIIQIVFAILLVIEPEEHVSFHIILLGIEMEIIALKSFIENVLLYYYNKLSLTE